MGLTPDALKQSRIAQQSDIEAERLYMKGEQAIAQAETAMQVETAESLLNVFEEAVNPLAGKFADDEKNIKERRINTNRVQKKDESPLTGSKKEIQDEASKFEKKNPELKAQILLLLLDKAKNCRDKEELLKLLSEFYTDPSVADDALDFLLATTKGSLKEIVQQAKDAFNAEKGREIRAGKNISEEVLKYSKMGLEVPTKLRDLYRDITGNPREPIALFLELGDKFSYKELRKVLAYLFHSLGADLKSQGPSIPPGMLHRLLTEVRNLQAGLGILHFFKNRMRLVEYLFEKNGFDLPKSVTFEGMSRQFITLLQERYPSPEKVQAMAQKLGVSGHVMAKIILLSQMRDAVREIAFYQFYRSTQHRDEIQKAIMDALEELEEELDELLEKEYEEDEEDDSGSHKHKQKSAQIDEDDEVDHIQRQSTAPKNATIKEQQAT